MVLIVIQFALRVDIKLKDEEEKEKEGAPALGYASMSNCRLLLLPDEK